MALPIPQLGFLAALIGVFGMVFTGKLVPKSHYDSMQAVYKDHIAVLKEEKAEIWDAWRTSEKTKALQANQLGELLELGHTTVDVVRSIKGADIS